MSARQDQQRIGAVRRFNRFYTRQIGVLRKNYLDSPYSLGEMRVLYELSHGEVKTASEIGRALDLDAGYLSRVLRKFEKAGLISRKTSREDARQSHLALTARGAKVFAPFEKRSQDFVGAMLGTLKADEKASLVAAMQTIETLLGEPPVATARSYTLRAPRHGDFGWIVARHAALYAQRIRLDRAVRGPVRADRRRLRQQFRRKARTLLDRRDERRERRLHHAGEGFHRGRAHPPAAGGAAGPRPGAWASAGGRMRRASRARPATARSRCGPTACSPPPAASTRRPASRSPPASRATPGART